MALLFGVLTAPCGALAGAAILWFALGSGSIAGPWRFGGWPAAVYLASMCAAIILLGPGAYSVDARLFGRREVYIPPSARGSENTQRGHSGNRGGSP